MLATNVQEATTTTGTGNITLAGVSENGRTFTSAKSVGERFAYYIDDRAGEWESGVGYLSSATVLVRETVLSSSNADLIVNFSAGTKQAFIGINEQIILPVPLAASNVQFVGSNPYTEFSSSGYSGVADRLIVLPYYVSQSFTAKFLGLRKNSAMDATFRMVIFNGSSGAPSGIIGDTGVITSSSFGTVRFSLLADANLKTGMYFLGFKWWGLDASGVAGGAVDVYRRNIGAYTSINPLGIDEGANTKTHIQINSTNDSAIPETPIYAPSDIFASVIPAIMVTG